jgi:hypothetical protein
MSLAFLSEILFFGKTLVGASDAPGVGGGEELVVLAAAAEAQEAAVGDVQGGRHGVRASRSRCQKRLCRLLYKFQSSRRWVRSHLKKVWRGSTDRGTHLALRRSSDSHKLQN